MEIKNTWIRFAGDRRAWTGENTTEYRWRIFVHPNFENEVRIKSLTLSGRATPDNNRTGWRPVKNDQGVIAWLDYFGDLKVKDGVAEIELRDPKNHQVQPTHESQ